MSTNISDITLQSTDGTLVARNSAGNLTYPMLFLDREPVSSDAQGWDKVLVFIEGDGGIDVSTMTVTLNEANNYFQSIYLTGDGAWTLSGGVEDWLDITSSSGQMEGVGGARIDFAKRSAFNTLGAFSCTVTITLANSSGEEKQILVNLVVSVPLKVQDETNSAVNGETLNITLASPSYTKNLMVIRDLEWHVENVNESLLAVSPTLGQGVSPDFESTLTVTKSPFVKEQYSPQTLSTTFQVVSLFQTVTVSVTLNISAADVTLEFVDPLSSEAGVAGTGAVYIYV